MYQYFDVEEIRKSFNFTQAIMRKGRQIYEEGQLTLLEIKSGYTPETNEQVGEIKAECVSDTDSFTVRGLFSKNQMLRTECMCKECMRSYYGFYGRKNRCAYMAAMTELLRDYLKEHELGDATDMRAVSVLQAFSQQHALKVVADVHAGGEKIVLLPRLQLIGGELLLSFKVGVDKFFVIKNLMEFCENVKNSENAVFGSKTKLHLQIENLEEKSKEWFRFINRVMTDEEQFDQYMVSLSKKSEILLFGWRLDTFFKIMTGVSVEFEDKDNADKKRTLRCLEAKPEIELEIKKIEGLKIDPFHGIDVKCHMPVFFPGVEWFYYVQKQYFCRVREEDMKPILPLIERADDGELSFRVGRNNLQDFYYIMLPQLEEVVTVVQEDEEEIYSYLPPHVEFGFYLDAPGKDIVCRIKAKYGDVEYSVLDFAAEGKEIDSLRMSDKEKEVLYVLRDYLPVIDLEKDELSCGDSDEHIYRLLEEGIDLIAVYGEIQCTDRFRNRHINKKPKVSLGVSVSNGMLELFVNTEDIDKDELLDILQSYRLRKKYHRLRGGDFVNLRDNSLQMIGEMIETMHLSPKDFVKGSLKLPMFRTLYLDKLLEESENVYITRDHYFRELVKSFRAFGDGNFEEPASLKGIMRGYQKKGYKWLRTLEAYGFGGILADDMGLGKTLQMISVLLAAKEEGRIGTSLIVCPASLVYNWGEELRRFAPALKVLLVTGNQEERRDKLGTLKDYDITVTSYDLLKRDIELYENQEFTYEVIDEAQFIKNHSTAASRAVKLIKSKTRFALTGTPIENKLSELWSIFDYLMTGFFYSYEVFRREFEVPIVKNQDEDAMKRLKRMAGPFILRRLKSNVLKDLPDKLEETRYVKLEEQQKKLYDAQLVSMQTQLAIQGKEEFNKNRFQILAMLTKLRQICCDPALCFENYEGPSAKLEACLDLVDTAIDGGHKILLFSQFTSMIEIMKRKFEDRGISYYTITGETGKEQRLKLVKKFNEDDTKVFLISLKAGGVGLNLTGADVVIHYDPWWNVAVQNQATDRAHRIGQSKKVTVYKMIVSGSVEEKIEKLQNTKRDLAEQVMEAGSANITAMTREEILDLLEC